VRVDEHTIDLAGSPVFYRSAEGTGTPVLYLHGVPTSSADFVVFLERTGGIALDLIGFGRSSKAGNLDYSLSGEADFVEAFLAEQELDRVQLVGHEWGAAVGLAVAARRPELLERAVLINALPLLDGFTWHKPARLWRRPVIGELVMGSTNRWLLARQFRAASARPEAWSDEQIAEVWERFDQGTQRAILRLHRSAAEAELAGAGSGLAHQAAPTLIVWGERDPWLPPRFAAAYAEVLPHARAETIPDGGHWPWLDDPTVIDRIAAFLASG
jgi:pimeloyl-ACP methyl ester carboxylesterase